ncbi:MAG: ribonuclease HI [Lysobacterales bacterium]
MIDQLIIHVDGACSGNPGRAGIGVVIDEGDKRVKEVSRYIGEATNNIAEYSALICALQEGAVLKARRLKIFSDSELVCKQVKGDYKVKNETLKALWEQVQQLIKVFDDVELTHVLREKNKEADKLATSSLK